MKTNWSDRPNILLVEDEESLHEVIRFNLEMQDYEVTSAMDGAQALLKLDEEHFDLIILDLMLPEVDGMQVLENIKLKRIDSPVLILSARNEGADRIAGLKKGADDYLTKPFELEELLLRIARLLRSTQKPAANNEAQYAFGNNTIHFHQQEAINYKGEKISLSKKEDMLLRLLIDHAGEVVSREKILNTVWGYNVYPTTRTIDNFILNFRRYFEEDSREPRYFHSVRGVGYRFTP